MADNQRYDVIIIGAGPGGIFSAYELMKGHSDLKVAVIDMGNSLDKHLLINGYRLLSEDPNGYFRKSNPVVYAFNHVPPHAVDVEDRLVDCLCRVYGRDSGHNVALKAMYVHNKIIDIYPFDDFNAELAIFGMNYYLLENGLMPIGMSISRQEYQTQVSDCLKGIHQ